MNSIDIFYHSDALLHLNSEEHPESPNRLRSAHEKLMSDPLLADRIHWREPQAIERDKLSLAHSNQFIDDLYQRSPETGYEVLDEDTTMNPHSLRASLLAAGALEAACKQSLADSLTPQFCLARPPGHHAEADKAMGFCLFNGIATAALALQQKGLRVVVVDFDVHHGNGSEDILADKDGVYFFSSFEHPLYPFSPLEAKAKNIFKYPLAKGSDGNVMREIYRARVFPKISEINPDIILISAGFDAHQHDPLAGLSWQEADYYWLTSQLTELAHKHCEGRLVSVLEGGYHLAALASSVQAHVRALMGISESQ